MSKIPNIYKNSRSGDFFFLNKHKFREKQLNDCIPAAHSLTKNSIPNQTIIMISRLYKISPAAFSCSFTTNRLMLMLFIAIRLVVLPQNKLVL